MLKKREEEHKKEKKTINMIDHQDADNKNHPSLRRELKTKEKIKYQREIPYQK